MSYFIRY